MTTKKKALIILVLGIIITVGIGIYMFNKSGREVQTTKTDFSFNTNTTEIATILVKVSKISLNSKFNITLADYEVAFKKGNNHKYC